jgi:hypothetical protein
MALRPRLCWFVLSITCCALTGEGSTVIPAVDPGELARSSDAVFFFRAIESSIERRSTMLMTVTRGEVLSVLAGPLAAGQHVEIVVPGGFADGVGWLVAGSPRFGDGSEYLIFAGRGAGIRWRPRVLADAVLRRERGEDGKAVLVPLEEARDLRRIGTVDRGGLVPAPVREAPFIARLGQAVLGQRGWDWAGLMADVASTWEELKVAPTGCAFLTYEDRPIRWQRFDVGGSQAIWADSRGDPELADRGFDLVESALGRWMALDGTSLDLVYGGTKDFEMTCTDGEEDDTPRAGDDIVVFADPCDDIDPLTNCGGTLAFGGPWFGPTHTFDADTWYTASSWFVVVNDGISTCLSRLWYELMLTHELGHGLGFGHTEDPTSLMYSECCRPHNALDARCARYLYPSDDGGASGVTVPVIAYVDGVGGTPWRSDVAIANPHDRSTQLELAYQPGDDSPIEVTRTLPPRSTLFFEDIVSTLFDAGDGRGPMRVTAAGGGVEPVIVTRTYAVRSFGNVGSGLPTDLDPAAATVSMPGLMDDSAFRSNVSVTAGVASDVQATFELFRADDGLIASASRTIAAGAQRQWKLGTLFPGRMRSGVPMTVRATVDQPGVVNASIVDNVSSDSAIVAGFEPSTTWTVPAVVHAPGRDGTVWTSAVSLWNASGGPVTVTLEFLNQDANNAGGGEVAGPISLEAFETRVIEDPVLDLFGVTEGAGALRIESSGAIVVAARVATAGPQGGTAGNGVRTVHGDDWSSGSVVLPGVRLRDGFRTNVGFVSGDSPLQVQCTLLNGNGIVAARATVNLEPRSFRQRSVQQIFGSDLAPVPDPVGTIIVEGTGDFLAYLTVIDGSSQDPVFVMPR